MEKPQTEAAAETRIVAALVLITTLSKFDALKHAAEELGARILYQRSAAPFTRLWIVERGRDEP